MSVSDAIDNTYSARRKLHEVLSGCRSHARVLREDLYERARAFGLTGNSDMAEYLMGVGDSILEMTQASLQAYDRESNAQSAQTGAEIASIFEIILNAKV